MLQRASSVSYTHLDVYKRQSQGSVKDRFLQYTMQNQAEYAIIPLADILGLGKEGHINTPGTIGSPNWEWHLPDFIQAKKELQKFGRLIVDTKR